MSSIKSVHWDITRKCNLRCQHCYNAEKYFNEHSPDYIANEMSLDECLHTVNIFASNGFNHIHFLGGEPLASPYIFDVIRHAKKYGMKVTINSNACLLTDDVRKKLLDLQIDHFAASLDGCTAQLNDSIRGNGTFEKVISHMRKLNNEKKACDSSLETALVFTLTQKNIGELMLLPALAEDIGVDLIALTTFIESGQGKRNSELFQIDNVVLCEAIEKMVSTELINHSVPLQIDMRPRICDYLSIAYNAPVIYNIKNSLCSAGEDIWYLEANGNVHPCLIFQMESGKRAIEEGIYTKETLNVSDKDITEIQHSKYWSSFMQAKRQFKTERIPTCKGCSYLKICQPCFVDYGKYDNLIAECEWVKAKEKTLFKRIEDRIPIVEAGVSYNDQEGIITKGEADVLILDTETSKDFWHALTCENRVKDIFDMLYQKYDVDEWSLKYDLSVFIYTLMNCRVIRMDEKMDSATYKVKDNVVCEEIDGEIIVFDTENEQFYEFDNVGSFLWKIIDDSTFDELVQKLRAEYDVDIYTASDDVSAFLSDLQSKQLIFAIEV